MKESEFNTKANGIQIRRSMKFDIVAGVMQLVPKYKHTVKSSFWSILHPGGVGGFSIWGK